MEHAYPDFGFKDALGFELREGTEFNERTYTIWNYLYNYVSGR